MKNKTLIYQEHRSKYCNPNSPRHCGHYVSPIPDANSSVYDEELQAFEKDLSRREDEYLIDLKNFFEGVEKYKKFKFELDEFANQLKEPVFSLEGTEKQLHDIQKMLDDRAREAELIKFSPEPIINNSDEEKSILEIENEIAQLENMLKSPMSETAISATKMLSDAQEMEKNNLKFSEELDQRKIQIKEQGIKLREEQNIEMLENEEEKMNQIYLKDKATLDSLPKVNLENILAQEKLKKDLLSRKQKTILKSKNFQITTRNSDQEIEKLQVDIQNLEKELLILKERRKAINNLLTKIHEADQINIQISKSLKETDEVLSQIKHSYENQKIDLFTIEKKKENLIKKSKTYYTQKKMLNEKDQMIKYKREELDNYENEFSSEREKLNEMKIRISKIDEEVEKYEKKAKSMIDKVNEVQEEIQEKQIEFIDSSSTSSIKDLKDLINDNIDSF